MIAYMASHGKVCLRPRSGKQYSLQRAVAQLGSALEWGSRGRGFKSRRPDFPLSMTKDESQHECCFCDESVPSQKLVTLSVFMGKRTNRMRRKRSSVTRNVCVTEFPDPYRSLLIFSTDA